MKHLTIFFAVLLFSGGLYAQGSPYQPLRYNAINTQGTAIYAKAFSSGTSDTVRIPLGNVGSLIVNLAAGDTTSILISYATSYNDTTYSSFTTIDSLKSYQSTTVQKIVDLSPYVGGANYMRVKFLTSALAYTVGVTNATYTATIEKFADPAYPTVNSSSRQWATTYSFQRTGAAITYTASYRVGNNKAAYDVYPVASLLNGATGIIQSAVLVADTANATNATFLLYLFNDTTGLGGTSVGDNVAQPLTNAMSLKLVGTIAFTLTTAGAGSTAAESYVTPALRYDTGIGTSLYGILVATATYKPKSSNSGGVYTLRLTLTQ